MRKVSLRAKIIPEKDLATLKKRGFEIYVRNIWTNKILKFDPKVFPSLDFLEEEYIAVYNGKKDVAELVEGLHWPEWSKDHSMFSGPL